MKTLHELSDEDVKQIMAHRVAWIEQLRTTTEPQTNGVLHRVKSRSTTPGWPRNDGDEHVGFCCLGIACEMVPGIEKHVSGMDTVMLYDNSEGSLPPAVSEWLGVVDDDPYVDLTFMPMDVMERPHPYDPKMTCAGLNDNWELTFPQIADMIAYFGFHKKSDVLLGAEPESDDD